MSGDGCCARGCSRTADPDCEQVRYGTTPLDSGADAGAVTIGDLDGNEIPDLVLGDESSEELVVLEGDGQGGFTPVSPASAVVVGSGSGAGVTGNVADLAVSDVNGDGRLDVVAAIAGPLPNTDALVSSIGDGAFGFTPGSRSPLAGLPLRLEMVELTADGRIDAVVATAAGLELQRNRGDGSFERIALLAAGELVSDVAVGAALVSGRLGVAAALAEQDQIKVYGGLDVIIEDVATIAVEEPRALAVGDFTSDGIEDLAVASGGGFVAVYVGRIGGGFDAEVPDPVSGAALERLWRTDVNGDGLADLVGLQRETASVLLLLGRGDGTFEGQAGPTTTGPSSDLVVADLNGDRVPDLVLSGVEILIGIAELSGPPIVAGDADGNGTADGADLDLLIGELFDGDGTDSLSCGGGSIGCAAGADANGDGAIGAADLLKGGTRTPFDGLRANGKVQ